MKNAINSVIALAIVGGAATLMLLDGVDKSSAAAKVERAAFISPAPHALDGGASDQPPALETLPDPTLTPLGETPVCVQEPSVVVSRDTPQVLLGGILEARDRGDRAFLARASSTSAGKDRLDALDLNRAYRRYLWKSPARRWEVINDAFASGEVRYDVDGENAVAIAPNRGGEDIVVTFEHHPDGWYLVSP